MSVIDDSWYRRTEDLEERIGAGGIVARVEGREVLIALVKEVEFGDEDYVIPKGGVEEGESIEQTALREIAEETGLTDLTPIGHLGALTRQSFKRVYWQTSHYGIFLTSQRDATITDPANYGLGWFRLRELPRFFWPDERGLVEAGRERIEARVRRFTP